MQNYLKNQINLSVDDQKMAKFAEYCSFLLSENEKYNLTALKDEKSVYDRHFIDSILGSVAIGNNMSLCDIGCGAGFPSIPLKIARDDISITLVDSLEKRVNFCKKLCNRINVNANFYHDRAEDFSQNHSEEFDIATARAVAPLNILLEYTAQIVKVGGIVLAYKTDQSELETCSHACQCLKLKYEKCYNFVLPDGSARCLLIFRKIDHTPKAYPRGQNKPRKSPL